MVGFQGGRVCTSVYLEWVTLMWLIRCSWKNLLHLLVCPIRGIYPREEYNRGKSRRLNKTEKARDEFILATLG